MPAPSNDGGAIVQDPAIWWQTLERRCSPCAPASIPSASPAWPSTALRHAAPGRQGRPAVAPAGMYNDPSALPGSQHGSRRPHQPRAAPTAPPRPWPACSPPAGSPRSALRAAPGGLDRRATFRPDGGQRREQRAQARLRPGAAPMARLDGRAGRPARAPARGGRTRHPAWSGHTGMAERFGLPRACLVVAGTTDGCAPSWPPVPTAWATASRHSAPH